jgi:hypothetical protein
VRLHPGGVLDGDDALVGRLVGERGAAHEVADRVDALGARAERAVDVDEAAVVELDAGLLEPEPSTSGPRPAAITNQSTSAVSSPYLKLTLSSPVSTFSTLVPVWMSMPCLLSPRPTTLEISASSAGTTRSSTSNSITFVPSRA